MHDLRNQNTRRHTPLLPVAFAALMIFSLALDHIWYGPAPAWLLATIATAFLLYAGTQRDFIDFLKTVWKPIIVPYLLFIVCVLISDTVNGRIDDTFSKRVVLNIAALGLLLVAGTCSRQLNSDTVILILVGIGSCQGLVAIGQFLQLGGFWHLPDTMVSLLGGNVDKAIGTEFNFVKNGRVRGLNLFVHMFNATQSVLVVFLITYLMQRNSIKQVAHQLPWHSKLTFLTIMPLTVIAGFGAFLTFSRSTILGGSLAILGVLVKRRSISTAMTLLIAGTLTMAVVKFVQPQESIAFERIRNFSGGRLSDQGRYDQYTYAIKLFSRNPIFGADESNSNRSILIHSVPLRLMCDNGLFGILPYFALLWGIVSFLKRQAVNGDFNSKIFAISGLAAMLVSILDSFTHSSGLLVRSVAQPAYVGIFLGLACNSSSSSPYPRLTRKRMVDRESESISPND